MATPIAATPILEGEDAEAFRKVHNEEDTEVTLTPTPHINEMREKMPADDRSRKE